MIKKELTWLSQIVQQWQEAADAGRLPHAVLLTGPTGTGKRVLADWMVAGKLGLGSTNVPEWPSDRPLHADLQWIEPPEDKDSIGIAQIRDLIANLALTSYEGKGKVAVVAPANKMTANAANSLLKTLEEPPGDTLIVLIADRMGRLPATIFSRCQRINVPVPAREEAIAWLDAVSPGQQWAPVLDSGGARPLLALQLLEQQHSAQSLASDLADLSKGAVSPISVASKWSKLETKWVLDWLADQVHKGIVGLSSGSELAPGLTIDNSVLQRMDRRKLICYLDIINRLRARNKGAFNPQLAFESLLIDWSEGLKNVSWRPNYEGLSEIRAAG